MTPRLMTQQEMDVYIGLVHELMGTDVGRSMALMLSHCQQKNLALGNVRTIASRMRTSFVHDAAGHLLRYCEQGGVVPSILRGEQ